MPLFYLRPFDFHADKREARRLIEVDFDLGSLLLTVVVGMVALGLFVAFIVIPLLTVLGEQMP